MQRRQSCVLTKHPLKYTSARALMSPICAHCHHTVSIVTVTPSQREAQTEITPACYQRREWGCGNQTNTILQRPRFTQNTPPIFFCQGPAQWNTVNTECDTSLIVGTEESQQWEKYHTLTLSLSNTGPNPEHKQRTGQSHLQQTPTQPGACTLS